MKATRLQFLRTSGAFAFAPIAGRLFASDEKPLFRMGVMTDTHVGTTLESCSRVKAALELFKSHKVDMIVNNGDIADHFYASGYRALRSIYNSTYPNPAERPREIWVYAWHDAFEFKKDVPREDTVKYAPEAFAEVRRLLEAQDPVTTSFTFQGIPMVVLNQFDTPATFERMVAEATAANPGKPVFVFSHVPPSGTVYNSWNWGQGFQRKIYGKFPQVVDFSGHVHGSLRNDLLIWQEEFTVINSGCLQHWDGVPVNECPPSRKESYGVLTVDVFPTRLLIRRFDVRDGSEIDPDMPWNVALPFSAATAAYTPERKKARATLPQYPKGATLVAKPDACGGITLSFPEVEGRTRAFMHRAEVERRDADGKWTRFAIRDSFGDFYLKEPMPSRCIVFQQGYFTPGEHIRFTVRPLTGYGTAGRPLTTECVAPTHDAMKTMFDVRGLPEGFRFVSGPKAAELKPDAEGFYAPPTSGTTLLMPAGSFAGPAGTLFSLACDLDMRQNDEGSMLEISVKDAVKMVRQRAITYGNVHTMPGSPGTLRIVFEFKKSKEASDDCVLFFRRGANSRVRFAGIRLDRSTT